MLLLVFKLERKILGGAENTFLGTSTGFKNEVGTQNTYVGYQAGAYASASYNTFVGRNAGLGGASSAPYSSGTSNTAVGMRALAGFTTGYGNTAVGAETLDAVTEGFYNIGI